MKFFFEKNFVLNIHLHILTVTYVVRVSLSVHDTSPPKHRTIILKYQGLLIG